MVPAVWAAWKRAGLAGKALSVALPIVLVVGAYWLGRWHGDGNGYERCQQEHAAVALKQAAQVVEHTAKQAELPARVLEGFIKERDESAKVMADLQAEIARYERDRKAKQAQRAQEVPHDDAESTCQSTDDPLDDDFVARWDRIGQLFLDTGGADAVSAADRDPAGVSGVPHADVQTPTLLRARAAEFAEYRELAAHYNGLREFSKGVYIFQKTWYESQQAQPK